MKKYFKQLFSAIFAFALFCTLAVPSLASVSPPGLETECSMKVSYMDAQHLENVRISVYRVADVNKNLEFKWTPVYADYHLKLSMTDPQTLALTLASYTLRDNLTPVAIDSTDENGEISFEGLETGMYLLVGEPYTKNNYICTPIPSLIYFPHTGEDGHWSYSADVEIKFEQTIDNTVSLKALKVWNDGKSDERPDSIQMELLRDGHTWDVVTLSALNNWRYTWEDLEKGHTWFVVEHEVPDGYTTSVVQEGITFVVTNTQEEPEEPKTPPEEPPTDTPEIPDPPKKDPEFPVETPKDDTPVNTPEEFEPQRPEPDIIEETKPSNEKLPQTGLNWEPVIYLATAGIGCLALGLIFNKKGSKEQ